jgi:hypothetical protein
MESNQETSQVQPNTIPPTAQDMVLLEILENTKKTKKYMAWQFYITIILIVLPLLAMLFLLPSIMSGLSVYTTGGLQ